MFVGQTGTGGVYIYSNSNQYIGIMIRELIERECRYLSRHDMYKWRTGEVGDWKEN